MRLDKKYINVRKEQAIKVTMFLIAITLQNESDHNSPQKCLFISESPCILEDDSGVIPR